MKIPSPRANKKARIEIIPLIDIIFFLLATFVMVSLSMVKNRGIPVNLPAAVTGAALDREESVSISLMAGGEIYFNKEPVTLEQLSRRLEEIRAGGSDPRVYINGDERAEYGRAIAVLDQVRALGITKVAIETKPGKGAL